MSIRNLQPGTSRIETSAVGTATDARNSAASSSKEGNATSNVKDGDRVELSAAARAQSSEARNEEMEQAREALLGLPPLDPQRKEDILRRVQEGYYSQPNVIKQTAERLIADLTGVGTQRDV